MSRPRRPRNRAAVGIAVGAVAVAGAFLATRLVGPPAKPAAPDMPETVTAEPPPPAVRPRSEDERIVRLVEFLLNGDTEDAAWARAVLQQAGPAARAVVAETAKRCLQSNRAFVEHAMDLLLRAPEPGDAFLAIEGLTSIDPEVVKRSCLLLQRLANDDAREAVPKLASLATESWPLPVFALDAVAALGGDRAADAIDSVVRSEEVLPGVRDVALARLGRIGGAKAREIALRELEAAASLEEGMRDDHVIAASEALVTMNDPAPIGRLRAMWQVGRDERALTLLARARDEIALGEIEARIHAPVESEDRLLAALGLLDSFEAGRRPALLRECTGEKRPRSVRAAAWAGLATIDESSRDEVARLLAGSGAATRDDRIVAALVAGRVRHDAWGASLLAAESANRGDVEVRAMLLRAMVLGGHESCAEAVVRAMATDPSGPLEAESVAGEIFAVASDCAPAMRAALGPWIVRALQGSLGTPGDGALGQIVSLAGRCCGPEAAPLVQPLLTHPSRHVRTAAAETIVWIPDESTLAALRSSWWSRQDTISRMAISRAISRVVLARPVR